MMASCEDTIIELFNIIQSIIHINKQKILLLFSLFYKLFLICFNCIKFIYIIQSYIYYDNHILILILSYDVMTFNQQIPTISNLVLHYIIHPIIFILYYYLKYFLLLLSYLY